MGDLYRLVGPPAPQAAGLAARWAREAALAPDPAVLLSALESGQFTTLLQGLGLEARSFKTVLRPVKLADLVMEAAGSARPDAEAKGVTLTAERPEGDLVVSGDPDQLDRALANLLSNAVKFTPGGGQVWAGAAAVPAVPPFRRPVAQVTIRDTGIGIPQTDQKHLFEQFSRASNAVSQAIQGTGIGLTIVRSIVANHHGTAELQSREGEGTTVVIRLPLREAA